MYFEDVSSSFSLSSCTTFTFLARKMQKSPKFPATAFAHSTGVGVVFESEDDEHEDGAGDEFGDELIGFVEEGL